MVATALVGATYLFPTPHADVRAAAGNPSPAPTQSQGGVDVWQDLRYADGDRAKLDIYRPARRARRLPGVMVMHGGGWRDGDKRRMSAVSRRIARSGLIAYSVNYSLARASRPGFRTQPRQLRQAVRWARRSARRFGLAPRRIGALGTSAGGHLAGLLGIRGRGPLGAGARVRAVATWSAPLDLGSLTETRMADSVNTFLGCLGSPCPDRQAAASPITHVSGDDPTMLIVNSRRELVPVSQARRMADRLSAAGVPHSLRLFGGSAHAMEYAARAIEPTITFLRRALRGRRGAEP
jgi:acetyl esterase